MVGWTEAVNTEKHAFMQVKMDRRHIYILLHKSKVVMKDQFCKGQQKTSHIYPYMCINKEEPRYSGSVNLYPVMM